MGSHVIRLNEAETTRWGKAIMIAERILQAVNEPIELHGQQTAMGASIGITIAPNDGNDVSELMKNAD